METTHLYGLYRKDVLFPAFLHGKKVFQFAASDPAFLLILLQTTFFLVFG